MEGEAFDCKGRIIMWRRSHRSFCFCFFQFTKTICIRTDPTSQVAKCEVRSAAKFAKFTKLAKWKIWALIFISFNHQRIQTFLNHRNYDSTWNAGCGACGWRANINFLNTEISKVAIRDIFCSKIHFLTKLQHQKQVHKNYFMQYAAFIYIF